MGQRYSSYSQRAEIQAKKLELPLFPTTTIGSFPQTAEIRKNRRDYRLGVLDDDQYRLAMREEIKTCVHEQESLDLDVLVHGEPERNDMVEYFGNYQKGSVSLNLAGYNLMALVVSNHRLLSVMFHGRIR